jgi:muramoyltetrapeptide carboxypeptidase LdcA involved in peptidoglycan recycling
MMSCVILATPYDLPATYLPALLTELTRHATVPALKDIVARTVQLFKRTHQDRWEEFKKAFSADQLDELQGTGAAHYFS